MKKLLVVMLSLMMVFAMCACGAKEEEPSGVANPVHECTAEEMLEVTGFELAAPEGAENAACAYIEIENEEPIAQLSFTLDGNEFCYRAQSTGATSIMSVKEEDEYTSIEDLTAALNDGTQIGAKLSGLNYEWSACATVDVDYCEGICAWNEGEAGFITWLDVAPGVLYSLGMNNGCNQELLMSTAESIFVPVQGNAG